VAQALPLHSALHMALKGDKAANRTACQGPKDLTVWNKQALGDPETLNPPKLHKV